MANSIYSDFPPHYDFPPFFTLQPNKETQSRQITIWMQLIKEYCEKMRVFILDKRHTIFTNNRISRSLGDEGVAAIFNEMVRTSLGEYVDGNVKDRVFVWWNAKEAWASSMLGHAGENGLLNSVATIFELEEAPTFQGMDREMLVKILGVLQRQGKCELMLGSDKTVEGVKFFM